MKARWLVAKYMPDLRRREPDNVGVILLMDGRAHLRFLGQRDGRVDGRSVRWAGSVKNYKAWVDYWTQAAETTPLEALTSKLTAHVGDANYIVEVGGERIFGDGATPEEMLDYLYTTLIEPSSDRRSFSVGRLSENLFGRLSIHEHVQKDFKLEIDEDTIHFDYRYDNGQMNLMQGVSLVNADDRSWDNVHRVAYEFAKSARSTMPHQTIALVNPREHDKDLDRQLRVLREHGKVVDVSNEVIAVDYLRELLHLAPGSSTT